MTFPLIAPMKDIDFLPAGYRQQHARQNVLVWRVVVVAGFLAMLGAASLAQYYRLCRARGQLADLESQHVVAQNQNAQLNRLQSDLKEAECDAELYTYLRHPWPRTQVLAALLAPLPDSMTLDALEIKVDARSRRLSLGRRRETGPRNEQAPPSLPAERDLAMFRDQLDAAPVIVVLSGRTTDSASVHRYLAELGRASLFDKVELDSLESVAPADKDLHEGAMAFKAVAVLRPGYGQPGGPTGSINLARRAEGDQAP